MAGGIVATVVGIGSFAGGVVLARKQMREQILLGVFAIVCGLTFGFLGLVLLVSTISPPQ